MTFWWLFLCLQSMTEVKSDTGKTSLEMILQIQVLHNMFFDTISKSSSRGNLLTMTLSIFSRNDVCFDFVQIDSVREFIHLSNQSDSDENCPLNTCQSEEIRGSFLPFTSFGGAVRTLLSPLFFFFFFLFLFSFFFSSFFFLFL